MRLLRAADRVPTPWKNGGGTTREVAVFPPGAGFDTFAWRVSMAEVLADGPFSEFPGIDRRLAVIEGRLSLEIAQAPAIDLSPESEPIALAGDVATFARVTAGPVTDLNVMSRRGQVRSALSRHSLRASERLQTTATTTLLIARQELSITHQGTEHLLHTFDALLLEGPAELRLAQATTSTPAPEYYLVELFTNPGWPHS